MTKIKTICLDDEIIDQLEEKRAGKSFFYSGYINACLREKLNLPRKTVKK